MTSVADALGIIATFLWLGMVIAISFLEAPLKFRAPGITIALGLGIGRMVFRALNLCEAVLAVVLLVARILGRSTVAGVVLAGMLVLVLAVQVLVLRPALDRRARAIIEGSKQPASRRHLVYVALEAAKVALLLGAGVQLVTVAIR